MFEFFVEICIFFLGYVCAEVALPFAVDEDAAGSKAAADEVLGKGTCKPCGSGAGEHVKPRIADYFFSSALRPLLPEPNLSVPYGDEEVDHAAVGGI